MRILNSPKLYAKRSLNKLQASIYPQVKHRQGDHERTGIFQTAARVTEAFYNKFIYQPKHDLIHKYFVKARNLCLNLDIPVNHKSSTGFGGGDIEDCLRHILTAALITRDNGIIVGKTLGDLCEVFDWVRGFRSCEMDIYNNNLGIALGLEAIKHDYNEDELLERVLHAIYGLSMNPMAMLDEVSDKRQVRFLDFWRLIHSVEFNGRLVGDELEAAPQKSLRYVKRPNCRHRPGRKGQTTSLYNCSVPMDIGLGSSHGIIRNRNGRFGNCLYVLSNDPGKQLFQEAKVRFRIVLASK